VHLRPELIPFRDAVVRLIWYTPSTTLTRRPKSSSYLQFFRSSQSCSSCYNSLSVLYQSQCDLCMPPFYFAYLDGFLITKESRSSRSARSFSICLMIGPRYS